MCFVQVEAFAGWDDCGGAVFSDDGGAGIVLAGAEVFAGVDCRFLLLAFAEDWDFGRGEPAERCSAWTGEGARPHMVHLPLIISFAHLIHLAHVSCAGLQNLSKAKGY